MSKEQATAEFVDPVIASLLSQSLVSAVGSPARVLVREFVVNDEGQMIGITLGLAAVIS